MEDPTGGMWIYLIFFLIPLARIIPRILKKYRRKNAGMEPEPAEKSGKKRFFTIERPEPPRYTEEPPPELKPEPELEPEPEPEPEPDNKGDWMKKDDFK